MLILPDYSDLIGKPFVRGGRGPDEYDCYGLVIEIYRRMGKQLPDFVSPGNLEAVEEIVDRESRNWRRVPFETVGAVLSMRINGLRSHVGIILPHSRVLHASENVGVAIDRLNYPPFRDGKIAAYLYD